MRRPGDIPEHWPMRASRGLLNAATLPKDRR
jgi:hypothetical protein